ncbi:CLUMA_CG011034, isoform A [Clunio marinus]|uniref:CLUMA_CG011034, isoform A n=1 Tax=Clunio marinus TaxID=568069 RepID=A0A1J1IGU0_9DIPT|nr:CLUMA_CG011034, isoform A [Clunio marinus]
MASTRDRRLKTDSPTPTIQSNETATTPSSKTSSAIKLKRMSRNRSGILSLKSENEDGNDSVGLSEESQNNSASNDNSNAPKTPNTRNTKRHPNKNEKDEEANGDAKEAELESSAKGTANVDTPRSKRLTKTQILKKKGAELALARRQALMKRKTLPLPIKSSLRSIPRRLSSKVNERQEVQASVKKTKPVRKTTAIEKKENDVQEDQSEKEGDPEEEKQEEVESSEKQAEETNDASEAVEVVVKQEKIDKSAISIDLQNVRRSTRQRKSTIKDRDSPLTARRSQVREKSESKRDSISPALSNSSIKVEKENSKGISITVEPSEATEKDPSLSPEMVSEEMDSESVQHLYDKPDFLENNLGIEKDPKLGEIVKVQEKTKVIDSTTIKDDEKFTEIDAEEKDEESEMVVNGGEKTDEKDTTDDETKAEIKMEEDGNENSSAAAEEATEDIKEEELGEENKENNMESSAKSVDSGSPRSEDRLKVFNEENVPKLENVDTELLKQKESHFLSLGLLTHKAADEAKVAKQKHKEELAKAAQAAQTERTKAKKNNNNNNNDQQYTGTLKTIIKLNRNDKEKRKTRMPLKMTFQKKNRDRDSNGSSNSSDSFYTIQEKDASLSSDSHDQVAPSNDQNKNHEPVVNKELEQSLVIPEKASSFKVHPERLCKDQCFYCGGKFGLYDTPCHIAQIKSVDRQKKILESEEKLTKDSCLCDACFRHVDRRANCPSYKKRVSAPSQMQGASNSSQQQNNFDRTFGICNVIDCHENAVHNIRKKWFLKMKKTISKIFHVDMDLQPTNANVSICEEHFSALSHIMVCAMCKRKLPRNHIFYINQDITRLEHLIAEQGMRIKLANSTLVVCKLCSYFNNLLFKPPEPKTQKADFVKNYTKKLLKENSLEAEYARQVIQVDDDDVQEVPNRNDNLTLTIKNGKIQPKRHNERLSKEVTITSMKGSILLDNDVMVGYDVPFPLECESPPAHAIRNPNYKGSSSQSLPKSNKVQVDQNRKRRDINDNNEMARALKSNPNISMRELFPGEDEMGLNVNLPLNTSNSQRTADGWFKTQMTVQYDEVTKALWENLQRPYGNQSSFLRHLVLLEKYYRNGDLVLSQSASNSAVTYSESVRNRLRSYDNIPSSSPVHSNFSNEITIIPASKVKSKTQEQVTITPQPGGSLLKRKASQSDMSNSSKQKLLKSDDGTPKKSSPPELISFTQKSATKSKDGKSVSAKEASESPPTFISSSVSITPTTNSSSSSSTTSTSQSGGANNGNVIVLPETLTPQERKQCSKSWRPTLIPITSGSSAMLNAGGPLYQTADGRKLPALVQVMSGGKPYHISINDYNRMCIIRREKIQHQLNQKSKQQNSTSSGSPNGGGNTFTNKSLSIIPMPKDKETFKAPAPTTSPNNARNKMVNIPNEILEQNSLIPLNSTNESNGKRQQNGTGSLPPLTSVKNLNNSNLMAMNQAILAPSALSDLSKTVNSLQPAAQLAAWKALWNDSDMNTDNIATLATFANLANLGSFGNGSFMDSDLLSKIPKSLTVIPQAKNDRRSSDEQGKHNSAST